MNSNSKIQPTRQNVCKRQPRQRGAKPFAGQSRRGAAVVELALVTPFLMILTLGVCEVGQALRVDVILSEAARAGCATAVRPGCTNQDVVNDMKTVLTTNGLPTSSATITILVNNYTGEVAGANQNDKITVAISIPASAVLIANTLQYFGGASRLSQSLSMLKLG